MNKSDLMIALSFLFIAMIGFGLGRLSAFQEKKVPIRVEYQGAATISGIDLRTLNNSDRNPEEVRKTALLVGSKNSDKYHFPWCSGAKRIKDANKIFFSSRTEAEKLGYKPAANCSGL